MGVPIQLIAGEAGATPPFTLHPPDDDSPATHPAASQSHTSQPAASLCDERFTQLADRQAGFMFRVAHGLLRNSHDAEDAVQEALLKLFRTGGWRDITDERAFLATTVWRVALDLATRRGRQAINSDPAGDPNPLPDPIPDPSASVETTMIQAGQRALLRQLIDELPPPLRQPLILSAVEEMTSREVGAVLGIPEATVRTRVMRARAELRRKFERTRLSMSTRTFSDKGETR